MTLLGIGEDVLITSKVDGTFDYFDMRNLYDRCYENFENNFSITRMADLKILNDDKARKYKLILPLFTSESLYNSPIIAMKKKLIESSKSKNYKIFALDQTCRLFTYEINENQISNYRSDMEGKFPLKLSNEFNLKINLERIFNVDGDIFLINCIDFICSKSVSNSLIEVLYILTNMGLVKVTLEGKDDMIFNVLYKNASNSIDDETNRITAFDISDTGHFVISFLDFTVRIYDEQSFTMIFQTNAGGLSHDSIVDKIVWSNIICKDEKSKLIRKSMLANCYLITNKNEFIIFDLNQKNTAIKVKKKYYL
jgi:hypothetical protein